MITKMYSYSCRVLMKLEFSRQILGKNTPVSNFMKMRLVGAEFFRTDRHDEANSRSSQVCERA